MAKIEITVCLDNSDKELPTIIMHEFITTPETVNAFHNAQKTCEKGGQVSLAKIAGDILMKIVAEHFKGEAEKK